MLHQTFTDALTTMSGFYAHVLNMCIDACIEYEFMLIDDCTRGQQLIVFFIDPDFRRCVYLCKSLHELLFCEFCRAKFIYKGKIFWIIVRNYGAK